MIQSFQNLQVVKRQQVDEFARRLIFPIIQAVVAVSENPSLCNRFGEFISDKQILLYYVHIDVSYA